MTEDRGPMPDELRPIFTGFRFSRTDGLSLVVSALLTWGLWHLMGRFALLLPYAFVHFFLFCNLLRMRRTLELLWASGFILCVLGALLADQARLWPMLALPLPLTALLAILEVRKPDYHGMGCERLNPNLESYLSTRWLALCERLEREGRPIESPEESPRDASCRNRGKEPAP